MHNDTVDLPLVHYCVDARTGSPPHPALILMHGVGSNEVDLLGLARQTDPSLFVISLRAPSPCPGFGYSWYDLAEGRGQSKSMTRSLDLVAQFLRHVGDTYPIDSRRIYLAGFSQGAAMTLATTLLHPELVAGAIALSGYLPPGLPYRPHEAARMPVFQAHGISDQVVPIDAGRQTCDALQGMPVDLTYREYPIDHEVSAPELRDLGNWLSRLLE